MCSMQWVTLDDIMACFFLFGGRGECGLLIVHVSTFTTKKHVKKKVPIVCHALTPPSHEDNGQVKFLGLVCVQVLQ